MPRGPVSPFLVEIHPNGTALSYSTGRSPALRTGADGAVHRQAGSRVILGPTPFASHSIRDAEMNFEDLLVPCTDGITEALSARSRERCGEGRLINFVRAARRQDLVAVLDRVVSEASDSRGTTPRAEDQTILVVKRRLRLQEGTPA